MPTAATPRPAYSATVAASARSTWRTYGQWLQRNITSSAGPSRSASLTPVPSADGSSKSGAGVPRGTISEGAGMSWSWGAGVADDEVAARRRGQLAADVEAEPEAPAGLQAGEALEDPLALGGRDAGAVVLHGPHRVVAGALADQPQRGVPG